MTAVLVTALVFGASAQNNMQDKLKDKDVPTAVQTSFKTAFPNAKDAEWKMKEGMYKVMFEVDDVDQMAAFDASGKMLSKGTKIQESELPAAVSSAIKGAYANKNIDEVYRVEKDGGINYLVKLNGMDKKIMYSADGMVVKEKMNH